MLWVDAHAGGDGCRVARIGLIVTGPGALGATASSSPESFPGYHDFPYNVTQATWSVAGVEQAAARGGLLAFPVSMGRVRHRVAGRPHERDSGDRTVDDLQRPGELQLSRARTIRWASPTPTTTPIRTTGA